MNDKSEEKNITDFGRLTTDFLMIEDFNALSGCRLVMSKEDQKRDNQILDINYDENVSMEMKETFGTTWIKKPSNPLFSEIIFFSKYKFSETEYQIANLVYSIIATTLRNYQNELVIDKDYKFSHDMNDKKASLLNNWFSISIEDVRKELNRSYSSGVIRDSIFKLLSTQIQIIYKEKKHGRKNSFSSGVLSGSFKSNDLEFKFQVSGFQQLLFREAFREIDFYKVGDKNIEYHSRNFDFRGLIGLKNSQKQIIFYLSDKFETMHNLRKNKTFLLEFTKEQIVECRNFDIYTWLDKEYKFEENKVFPKHKNIVKVYDIKTVLQKRLKKEIYKIRYNFKQNIKLLAEHDIWKDYFKLARDGKSVKVLDFTRITKKNKFNPCKKIDNQSPFNQN